MKGYLGAQVGQSLRRPFEVLDEAIPRGMRDRLGLLLGLRNGDLVRRWCRAPETTTDPTASGRRSSLDAVCRLLDAAFAVNPNAPALIAAYINEYVAELQHGGGSEFNPAEAVIGLSRRFNDAVAALLGRDLDQAGVRRLRDLDLYVRVQIETASAMVAAGAPLPASHVVMSEARQ